MLLTADIYEIIQITLESYKKEAKKTINLIEVNFAQTNFNLYWLHFSIVPPLDKISN